MGPDTRLGWNPKEACADCGVMGVSWGTRQSSLVPEAKDTEGPFVPLCDFCYQQRIKRKEEGLPQLPLGVKPPGVPQQSLKRPITVITRSSSVYKFELPDENDVRRFSCANRKLDGKCIILLLKKDEQMWLRRVDVDPEEAYWHTSPVFSIVNQPIHSFYFLNSLFTLD